MNRQRSDVQEASTYTRAASTSSRVTYGDIARDIITRVSYRQRDGTIRVIDPLHREELFRDHADGINPPWLHGRYVEWEDTPRSAWRLGRVDSDHLTCRPTEADALLIVAAHAEQCAFGWASPSDVLSIEDARGYFVMRHLESTRKRTTFNLLQQKYGYAARARADVA